MGKIVNLVPAIKKLEKQIKEEESKFKNSIKPLRESLNQLRQLNGACEKCYGTGKILRSRSCAEDDRPNPLDPGDYRICLSCNGTGIKGV